MDHRVDLMARYCDGDSRAFRQLYALVSPSLYRHLYRLGGDHALVTDLVQRTFLEVHRGRAACIRGADPLPWIYAIAERAFRDHTRPATDRRSRTAILLAAAACLGGLLLHFSGQIADGAGTDLIYLGVVGCAASIAVRAVPVRS